ncbi:MAG: flagellar basal body-associated FliL family protein [Burkholderiaceae bacterium]
MSTTDTAAAAKPPAKSKKLLIIAVVVVLLVVVGAAMAWAMSSRNAVDENGEEGAPRAAAAVAAPTFLPMETMVVNLADAGGERFAQIGITLELADEKTADKVKQYMPSIRSSILLLVSQRSSDELLVLEGKEKLAVDIAREVSRPLGFGATTARDKRAEVDADEDEDAPVKRRKTASSPVRKVHFSGFIIQ